MSDRLVLLWQWTQTWSQYVKTHRRNQEHIQASARCRRVYTQREQQLYLLSVVGNKCNPHPTSSYWLWCVSLPWFCLTIFSKEREMKVKHGQVKTLISSYALAVGLSCNPNSCQLETQRFLFSDPELKSWDMFAQSAHNPACFHHHHAADLSPQLGVCVCWLTVCLLTQTAAGCRPV